MILRISHTMFSKKKIVKKQFPDSKATVVCLGLFYL